jgi:type VI secretion system protein ImpL
MKSGSSVLLVVGLLLVAVLVGLVLVLLWRKAKRAALPVGVEDLAVAVRGTFSAARATLHARTSDRLRAFITGNEQTGESNARRILVLGLEGSGKTALLRQVAGGATIAPPAAEIDAAACNIFRLDGAIAVEVAGRVLRDEDGAGGAGEGLHAVLDELRRAFPDRPVDAIVVTVSCGNILPGAARAKIEGEARLLRKRIDEVLQGLAMRTPVYLLVTQIDQIPSFESFSREIEEGRRQRILGWSTPDAPFDEASADWASEALASVADALSSEQTRRFAADTPAADAVGYFVFPEALAASGEALGWLVDPIFLERGAGAPPVLRGVYFSGRAAPPRAAPPLVAEVSAAPLPPVLFTSELFQRKILPECSLARPSVEAQQRRGQIIRALQIATVAVGVLWGAVLAVEWSSIGRRASTVWPFLRELSSDLVQLQSADASVLAADAAQQARCTYLLDHLSGISTDRLRSYAAPTTLFSRLDARIEDAIALAYDRVLFASFRRTLVARSALPPEPLPPPDALDLDVAVPIEQTPEFKRADRWVQKVAVFESNLGRFNGLIRATDGSSVGEKDIQSIADLAESLYGKKLDQTFFSNAKYYTEALSHPGTLKPLDVESISPAVRKTADEVFDPVQRRLLEVYSDDVIRVDIDEILKDLGEIEAGGADYSVAKLKALRDAIVRLEADLGRAGLTWVASSTLPSPPEYERLLKAIQDLRLLGPDVALRLRSDEETKLRRLQNALKHAQTPLAGPLLARKDGVLQAKLAPAILALKEPIEALLRQTYMTGEEESVVTLDLEDAHVTWDVDLLKSAAKVAKEYEAFLQEGGFKPYPERMQATLLALAARRVRARVLVTVARAGRLSGAVADARVPDHVLRVEVENLAQAATPLRELLATLDRTRLADARDPVRAAARGQGVHILKTVYRTLEEENLFRGIFDEWEGRAGDAYRAFGVADDAQFGEYIVGQRGRAEALTKGFAEPVLGLLESPEVNAQGVPVVATWDVISAALHDYEGKKAGNSVSQLERFIQTELPALTLENCAGELERAATRARGDYFSERNRMLRRQVTDRCRKLLGKKLSDSYDQLRRRFNRSLSEKFPFSKSEQAEDAPLDAVREILADANDFRKRYRPLLASRESAKSVVRFLDKLDAARVFLEPLWAQGELVDGSYEVRVEFRANVAREIRGNQIVEWSTRIAEAQLSTSGPKDAARWHINDPVRVQLRWAKNSPDVPTISQGEGSRATVQDRTVTFEERGLWSLLRLIAVHQSAILEPGSKSDAASLLLFAVRTAPDSSGGYIERVGSDAGLARVFLRLTLAGTDKDKILKYPDFPPTAPGL